MYSNLMVCCVGVSGSVLLRKQLAAMCFFQAEDGIRDLVRSRGLGDVYKRQASYCTAV